MKKAVEELNRGVPTYWKARLLLADASHQGYKGFWAYTQSLSEEEIRFQSERKLKKGAAVKLEVFAIHQGQKHHLLLGGKVLSSVLLACGTLYGIDLEIKQMKAEDKAFIQQYLKDKKNMKLTYTSF
ncbi:hypothetical protein [Marinospirillum perlucidum]|uniref:hypothetical protein n=1 Tax=Marinospirillum perlucidum TaxID=1982602 RepID=UPI000DF29881|nr:hypothetical protein [Marinospirillum perlucidum]